MIQQIFTVRLEVDIIQYADMMNYPHNAHYKQQQQTRRGEGKALLVSWANNKCETVYVVRCMPPSS